MKLWVIWNLRLKILWIGMVQPGYNRCHTEPCRKLRVSSKNPAALQPGRSIMAKFLYKTNEGMASHKGRVPWLDGSGKMAGHTRYPIFLRCHTFFDTLFSNLTKHQGASSIQVSTYLNSNVFNFSFNCLLKL